ncbi:MAG: maleylpyruvate isomerase family mycothiol-dependent enzyme [Dehalococcoidia bacterium]
MYTPEERVSIAKAESERLKSYLAELPAEAWTKPSACERWEVRDVVAHLALACAGYTGHVTRALQGDTSTPEGGPLPSSGGSESAPPQITRVDRIAQRTLSYRESMSDSVLDAFIDKNGQLLDLLTRIKPDEWDKPCFHTFQIVTIQTLTTYTNLELTLHGWDIRSQLEPAAPLAPDSLGVVVEHFPDYLHWSFMPGEALASPVTYRIELNGALTTSKDFKVQGDRAWVEDSGNTPADASFRCDTELFGLVLCGRVNLDVAIGDGRIMVDGDPQLARGFGQWFQFQKLGEA